MRKWRDMERQMAPKSQMFSQGGIRSRDWFSDRLERREKTDGYSLIAFLLLEQIILNRELRSV